MYATNSIAILLATYNGEQYLSKQIDSLLNQTYKDITIFIHDDGSTDGTRNVIDELCDKYNDRIVNIEGPPTGGAKSNFMYLLREVNAPYYMCCDQDDVWDKNKVLISYNELMEMDNNRPALVFTDLCVVDKDLNIISKSMVSYQDLDVTDLSVNKFILSNVIVGCTTCFNKQLRDMAIKLRNTERIFMHDRWLGLIAARFGSINYIPTSTVLYRQHNNNAIGAEKNNLTNRIKRRILGFSGIKDSYIKSRMQAKEFAEVFSLSCDDVIYQYGNIEKLSKRKRLQFYRKNGMAPRNYLRNPGQLIWG